MDLETEGSYRVEGGKGRFSGNYAFSFRWTGMMERDDEDYLLYGHAVELVEWQARETAAFPEFHDVLTTEKGFPEKPAFSLKYILSEKGLLHINCLVEGFLIPRHAFSDTFHLVLPSSEENKQNLFGVDYNSFLTTGSNRIFVPEKDIRSGRVEKEFSWAWRHRQETRRRQQMIAQENDHRVKVRLVIIPRF